MANSSAPAARSVASLPASSSVREVAQLVSPRGTKYRVLKTHELDPYEPPLAQAEMVTMGAQRVSPGDDFTGKDRKDAKLSIASANVEPFGDLQELLNSLPADDEMIKHVPPLTTDQHSNRVAEEDRNLKVQAFLYAASQEGDHDYHFIVGRDPNSPAMYMNMELSGLPPHNASSFAKLKAARDAFKAFIGPHLPGPGYHHYDPPIPIEVQGSLFFDITHAHGPHPGPAALKPNSIFEIHPITDIKFEP